MVAVPKFRIETTDSRFRETGSRTTIKLAGELDSATCAELVSRVERVLEAQEAQEIVLDLAAVSFIDSSGMRAIVVVERAAAERGIGLTIVSPAEPVTDLLRIIGIADRLPLASRPGERHPPGRCWNGSSSLWRASAPRRLGLGPSCAKRSAVVSPRPTRRR